VTKQVFPSGIKALDEALHGGFAKPANFLLISAPLAAKRELGLALLNAGLNNNEAAIYISTSHTAEEIETQWTECGLDNSWKEEGKVKFVDCYSRMLGETTADTAMIRRIPSILDYSKLAVAVNEWSSGYYLQKTGVRILLDSLSSFLVYSSLQTVMRFLHVFLGQLRRLNVLGFFLLDEGAHDAVTFNQLKAFSDGAIRVSPDDTTLQLEGSPEMPNTPIPYQFSSKVSQPIVGSLSHK
jgi:KaiC/GvpD/RAD55 family RecA-like ATPase